MLAFQTVLAHGAATADTDADGNPHSVPNIGASLKSGTGSNATSPDGKAPFDQLAPAVRDGPGV
jgi:hypothetical protein